MKHSSINLARINNQLIQLKHIGSNQSLYIGKNVLNIYFHDSLVRASEDRDETLRSLLKCQEISASIRDEEQIAQNSAVIQRADFQRWTISMNQNTRSIITHQVIMSAVMTDHSAEIGRFPDNAIMTLA